MTLTLLDGGLGQELIHRCGKAPTGLWSAQVMLDTPELVTAVHTDFFEAGAQIATANSYLLHENRLAEFGLEDQLEPLNRLACQLAVQARDKHGSGLVAGSLGPGARSYRPDLALDIDQAATSFAQIAQIQAQYVDILICETMSSLDQARGALMGATQANKPVWLAVSVDDDAGNLLRSGEPLTDVIPLVEEFNLDALLVNCSLPEAVTTAIQTLGPQPFAIGAYANGFTEISPDFKQQGSTVASLHKRTDLSPLKYAEFAAQWFESGASLIGGCCEVGPKHIAAIRQQLVDEPL